MGHSGFSFIDQIASSAQSLDQLEWIVAHNISHELMLAFGVPENFDQSGAYVDSKMANWAMMVSSASTFSPAAAQAISQALAVQNNGMSGYQLGAQEVNPAAVPEPTTIAPLVPGCDGPGRGGGIGIGGPEGSTTRVSDGCSNARKSSLAYLCFGAGRRSIRTSTRSYITKEETSMRGLIASITRVGVTIALVMAKFGVRAAALAQTEPKTPPKPTEPAKRASIYNKQADAKAQVEKATAQAKKDNKRVLLMFGGDWCGWCHKLHELFASNRPIRKLLYNEYSTVMIELESPNAADLLKTCKKALSDEELKKGVGFPFLAVLDSDGKVLTGAAD